MASAGDVNNDGYDDIIVGAPKNDFGNNNEGLVSVYYGHDSHIDEYPDWRIEGNQDNVMLGFSVASAEDVNGDGYDDILVGSPFYSNNQIFEGRTIIYRGAASGLDTNVYWQFEGDQNFAFMGWSVSGITDYDNNGFDDILLGAPFYDDSYINDGKAELYTADCL